MRTAIALLGCLLAATGCSSGGSEAIETPSDPTESSTVVPTAWRLESWRGVTVQVPADWAYGGAPMKAGRSTLACAATAMVSASGGPVRGDASALPYVGRPILLTDVCWQFPSGAVPDHPPEAPSVWLGASVAPGSVDLGAGWVRETVEVSGTTVSVTSDDPGLREHVLGSATGPQVCPSRLGEPERVDEILIEGYGRPQSLEVCAYRRSNAGDLELGYATVLGADAARAFAQAVGSATPRTMECGEEPPFEWVTLKMTGTSYPNAPIGVGGTQDMVIGCGVVETSPGETYELDRDVLDTLRVEGLPAVLFALIGPQG
jgi:hypothetical protein